MTAKLGVPDSCPKNVVKVGALAEECGWTVVPTYVMVPDRNITLRFAKGDHRIWAAWVNGSFWRSYASTCQRLSYRDLEAVILDPDLLIPEDPEFPFGQPEVGECNGAPS